MTREEEERQRVAKAHENIAKWQEKYGGFSGGFRVIHQDASGGVREISRGVIGDPAIAARTAPPSVAPPAPVVPASRPAKLSWWQRLLSLFR